MNNHKISLTMVLAVLSLCCSVACLALLLTRPWEAKSQAATPNTSTQYVMYVGTNDKDTNEPVCSPEEAKVRAAEILVDHFGGYTIQEANGGWEDDGNLYQEYTLVIYLSDTTLDAVHAAGDDMIRAFHQSSVLIQANETTTEFYSGNQ